MNYIALYAEDYDWDVWEEYCNICGVGYDATCIRIKFDLDDVEYDCADNEEDDEDYDD